jgi:hypothetical protein
MTLLAIAATGVEAGTTQIQICGGDRRHKKPDPQPLSQATDDTEGGGADPDPQPLRRAAGERRLRCGRAQQPAGGQRLRQGAAGGRQTAQA